MSNELRANALDQLGLVMNKLSPEDYEPLRAAVIAVLADMAPVPTSGAVEVAREVWHLLEGKNNINMLSINGMTAQAFDTKAAAIIQQAIDAALENISRNYADEIDRACELEAALVTPPAADGKLREALALLRDWVLAVEAWPALKTDQPKYVRRLYALADRTHSALAQPASGGGA